MRLARHREVTTWEGKHDVHVDDISGAMLGMKPLHGHAAPDQVRMAGVQLLHMTANFCLHLLGGRQVVERDNQRSVHVCLLILTPSRIAPLPSGLALGRAYVSVVAFSATADRKTLADHEEFKRLLGV
jgi:hypothetical protein